MKIKTTVSLLVLFFGTIMPSIAQKIGYANIDLILAYMPESQNMQQNLQTYQIKLSESLKAKEQYGQIKYQEYLEKAKANEQDPALKPLQEELVKLDEELRKETAEAEQKLLVKRQDLMAPIVEKLQREIKALSADEGYTYIFNTVDGSGVSIVLQGPEEHDLTKKLMTRLGIQIPEE